MLFVGLFIIGMAGVVYLINKQYQIDQQDTDWRQ